MRSFTRGTPPASGPRHAQHQLLSSTLIALALVACGGSDKPAQDASEHSADSADKANDAANKAADKADQAADKANDAASSADKSEKENDAK